MQESTTLNVRRRWKNCQLCAEQWHKDMIERRESDSITWTFWLTRAHVWLTYGCCDQTGCSSLNWKHGMPPGNRAVFTQQQSPQSRERCTKVQFWKMPWNNIFLSFHNGVRVRLVPIPEPKYHDSTEKEAWFQTERKMDQSFQHLIFCLMCTELLSRVPLSVLLSRQNQLLCCWLIFRRDNNLIHWHFAGF